MTSKDLFDKYGLTLGHKSEFFKFAKQTNKLGNLLKYIKGSKTKFKYGETLTSQLDLPNWPKELAKPEIYCFNTPENNAITIGRLKPGKKGFEFQLPRYHLGVPAQMDLVRAMRQVVYSKEVRKIFKAHQKDDKQIYAIEFTREGHLANFQEAVYRGLNKTIPFTLVHVKHFEKGVNNQYKRVTMVSKITLEGLYTNQVKLAVLIDSVASGMQQVAVGEYLLNQIKQAKQYQLEELLVVAPMLNLWGAVVISLWAASNKLKVRFITCGGLLLGPDKLKYFSAVLTNKKVAVSPKLAKLHQLAHDKNARDKACVRSNWTASFLAPNEAIRFSDQELKSYGSSNKKVLRASSKITLNKIKRLKIDPRSLIPYSTLYEAKRLGREKELRNI